MDSALDLFTAHGYEAVRVEDVAREAGVSRATFYNHFNGMVEVRDSLTHVSVVRTFGTDRGVD